jgi:hypothetical protein
MGIASSELWMNTGASAAINFYEAGVKTLGIASGGIVTISGSLTVAGTNIATSAISALRSAGKRRFMAVRSLGSAIKSLATKMASAITVAASSAITFVNSGGAPGTAAGDKLILYNAGGGSLNYTLGIGTGSIFHNVPAGGKFQWFASGVETMSLDANSKLSVSGGINAGGNIVNGYMGTMGTQFLESATYTRSVAVAVDSRYVSATMTGSAFEALGHGVMIELQVQGRVRDPYGYVNIDVSLVRSGDYYGWEACECNICYSPVMQNYPLIYYYHYGTGLTPGLGYGVHLGITEHCGTYEYDLIVNRVRVTHIA